MTEVLAHHVLIPRVKQKHAVAHVPRFDTQHAWQYMASCNIQIDIQFVFMTYATHGADQRTSRSWCGFSAPSASSQSVPHSITDMIAMSFCFLLRKTIP